MTDAEFLNVDLDIESSEPLAELVRALEPALFCLHEEAGRVTLELTGDDELDADATARRLAEAVTALPPAARRLWDGARTRAFSVGVRGGRGPQSFELALAPATVALIAALGASIGVTVYAPD